MFTKFAKGAKKATFSENDKTATVAQISIVSKIVKA